MASLNLRPKRSPSPYRIFIRYEHERIAEGTEGMSILEEDVRRVLREPQSRHCRAILYQEIQENKGMNLLELGNYTAQKWSELPTSSRKIFVDIALEDSYVYEQQLQVWQDNQKRLELLHNLNREVDPWVANHPSMQDWIANLSSNNNR
eukprot:CAMPEP_0198140634 /NCGR_PEP_ID=MMETSP1443-20131203/3774_1 /TAXON_ID=186043 /ORGANISM="Entomoneis sp., Strain CCMP2396" /LENGTH=148 /DNA_ID=CAMNT_0043803127 /DNA_START=328 /DNA_END=774 /DNA_ORIENTATION=+